jgi:hypothetical protein
MIEIRRVPPPVTQIDPAPKTTPRTNPSDVAIDKARDQSAPILERRKNPDRRRNRGDAGYDRRTGDRRRRSIDISI